jgi:DNA polymerase-3 subunit alpha
MQIVKDIANFNLVEAENLRKAIGKKLPEVMAKVKAMFMSKAAEAQVVTEKEAEEIFGWIQASQRYSFNKSHSVSYAFNGYMSAYCKAHFIRPFFTSYLMYAKEKIKPRDEMKELVNNAKNYEIDVRPPDFRKLFIKSDAPIVDFHPSMHFMLREKIIYTGFTDVKGVGIAAIQKLIAVLPSIEKRVGASYDKWTWLEFLLFCTPHMNKTVVHALIQVGAFPHFGLSRMRMLYEYDALQKLTDKELRIVQEQLKRDEHKLLIDVLRIATNLPVGKGGCAANKNRLISLFDIVETLRTPPYKLEDAPEWIAGIEESLVGIPITCTKVEGKDISAATCTCQEFIQGKQGYVIIAGQITNVNEIKTKSGKSPGSKMAFLTISDKGGSLDSVVVFPDPWAEFKGIMVSGNLILVGGEKGKDNSLIVKNAWQL